MAFFLNGCGDSKDRSFNLLKNYKQPPDTDVTSSPEYNFSSFTGTVWKTKVKVALADFKRHTGEHSTDLITPEFFDPTHPKYTRVPGSRIIAVLPVGTRVRIERLMKDKGVWGGLRVAATVEDGTNSQETIYLSVEMLATNKFMLPGQSSSTNWDVDPDLLEKADKEVEGHEVQKKQP